MSREKRTLVIVLILLAILLFLNSCSGDLYDVIQPTHDAVKIHKLVGGRFLSLDIYDNELLSKQEQSYSANYTNQSWKITLGFINNGSHFEIDRVDCSMENRPGFKRVIFDLKDLWDKYYPATEEYDSVRALKTFKAASTLSFRLYKNNY